MVGRRVAGHRKVPHPGRQLEVHDHEGIGTMIIDGNSTKKQDMEGAILKTQSPLSLLL